MKIAMTHIDLPNEAKGGVAHGVHYLANTLQSRGHDVTMYTYSPFFEECSYKIVQIARPSIHRAFQSFAFAVDLAKQDFSSYEVIHCNGDGYWMNSKTPRMRTFHGSAYDEARSATSVSRRILQSILAPLEELDSKKASLSVGISEATRLRLPRCTEIIPHGVDLKRFHTGEKSARPSLLFVGTLEGRKRGQFLADCFHKEILPQVPDAELWTVCDRDVPGPNVVNFGRVSNERIAELYRQAWVFCLPSTYEGQGIPYLEAMASGTVAVASPNPGAKEVLENGKWGPVVEDAELGPTLRRLLQDPQERAVWEKRGLERAPFFDGEAIAARYEALYERLISGRR